MANDAEPPVIYAKDYSEIGSSNVKLYDKMSKPIYFEESYGFPKKSTPENLSLYYDLTKGNITAYRYAGVMPLTNIHEQDENIAQKKRYGSILVSPRFQASATKMLAYIMESDDFYEIQQDKVKFASKTSSEWKNVDFNKRDTSYLFGMYQDLPELEIPGKSDEHNNNNVGLGELSGVFEAIDFINNTRTVCQKMLRRQSQTCEENFVGKVKGKINLQKQIKYNLFRGRMDRNYCTYNKMTIDNKENRILKYALYLVCALLSNYPSIMEEEISYCKRTLHSVQLVKCTLRDFNGLKNNSVFKHYTPALESAKKIISRISVSFEDNGDIKTQLSNKVKPFFIQMDLMFELYARAVISNSLKKINADNKDNKDYELAPYQEKYNVFSAREIPAGFENTKIPDLVIRKKNEENNYTNLVVMDAKYSVLNSNNRERTLQILAYMFLLDCKVGGFISPAKNEEKKDIPSDMTVSGAKGFHLPLAVSGKMEDMDDIEQQTEIYLKEILEKILENEGENRKGAKKK